MKLISGERSFDTYCNVVVSVKDTIRIALLVRDTPRLPCSLHDEFSKSVVPLRFVNCRPCHVKRTRSWSHKPLVCSPLPKFLWAEGDVWYIHNRTPTKALKGRTPQEHTRYHNGDRHNVSLLHGFGVLRANVEQKEHIEEFGDQVTMSSS